MQSVQKKETGSLKVQNLIPNPTLANRTAIPAEEIQFLDRSRRRDHLQKQEVDPTLIRESNKKMMMNWMMKMQKTLKM